MYWTKCADLITAMLAKSKPIAAEILIKHRVNHSEQKVFENRMLKAKQRPWMSGDALRWKQMRTVQTKLHYVKPPTSCYKQTFQITVITIINMCKEAGS